MSKLWVLGGEMGATESDTILHDSLRVMRRPAVLFAPWDDVVQHTVGTFLDRLGSATDWGIAVDDQASVRWRSDGSRALVGIVATHRLLPSMNEYDVKELSSRTVRMFPRYVVGTAFAGGLTEISFQGTEIGRLSRFVLPAVDIVGGADA